MAARPGGSFEEQSPGWVDLYPILVFRTDIGVWILRCAIAHRSSREERASRNHQGESAIKPRRQARCARDDETFVHWPFGDDASTFA
jgi:hypothetical protein